MKHVLVVFALTSCLLAAGATRSAEPAASSHEAHRLVTSFGPIESHDQLFRGEVVEYAPLTQNPSGSWIVRLETNKGHTIQNALVSVSASMPENPGVAARPAVARYLGGGRYEISGLDFDREGWWNVGLVVRAGRQVDSLAFNLLLP